MMFQLAGHYTAILKALEVIPESEMKLLSYVVSTTEGEDLAEFFSKAEKEFGCAERFWTSTK